MEQPADIRLLTYLDLKYEGDPDLYDAVTMAELDAVVDRAHGEILRLYRAGQSIRQIAAARQLSRARVRKMLAHAIQREKRLR